MKRLALAWLRKEDWSRWLALDPNFQPDYAYWLRRMESAFLKIQSDGVRVVKIDVGIDDFLAWSGTNCGGRIDGDARATFAAMAAQRGGLH